MDMDADAREGSQGSKEALLFVNKKKQKNFIGFWTRVVPTPREAEQKSFLVLFFKKERLALESPAYNRTPNNIFLCLLIIQARLGSA